MAQLNSQSPVAGGRHRQAGFSLWSALYVLATLGLIALVGIRSVPVYLNNQSISGALHAVAQDPDLQGASRVAIERALSKRFEAGYAEGVSAHDLRFSQKNGARTLELDYEARRPLMFNIALVYHFDDVVRMPGGRAPGN